MQKVFMQYIAVLLLFGSNGIVASSIELNSYEIVFFRTLIASVFLVGLLYITRNKWTFYRFKKDALFVLLGGGGLGASWIFLFEAYTQIGVSIATLLYYCGPVIVMACAPLLFRERFTSTKLIGFSIVIGGMLLLNSEVFLEGELSVGFVYGLGAACMYAIMVIFNKKNKQIQGLENTTLQLIAAFVLVTIYMFVQQGWSVNIPKESILPLLILGLVNTGIGCFLYFSAITRLPVQSVSVLGYLEPLSALLLSTVLLGEHLTAVQLIGAACILGGAAFAELYRPKRAAQLHPSSS